MSGIVDFIFGGGPEAPQPDPAIGQAAQANSAISKEALDFARQQYEENKPRQAMMDQVANQVVQKQLELQDKSAAQADDYASYMKATFRPVEQSLVADAQNFDTEAKREELAGRAAADVQQAAGAADAATARDLARYGINPADGAYADAMAGSSRNKTAAMVGAMNKARTDARAEGRAFKFDVAGLGRGLPAAGATSTGLAINAGNNAVGNAAAPISSANTAAAPMTTGFSTGLAGNNSAGNLYSNIFDGQLQAYKADQAASAGLSSGLGQLSGMLGYGYLTRKVARGGIISRYGVQRRGYADGGIVVGSGTGTSDSVPAVVNGNEPAALSNGEGVLTADAVDLVGEDFVHRINRAAIAIGGINGRRATMPREMTMMRNMGVAHA